MEHSELKHTHNKTLKRSAVDTEPTNQVIQPTSTISAPLVQSSAVTSADQLRNLLDESARDAFMRPWHRLERGLRLNRLRMYVEQMAPQCSFTAEEKSNFFGFLQRALDRKLLNTHKIVNYIPEQQRIESIRGLEVRRAPDGTAKWGFSVKKTKEMNSTRKKRKTGEGDTDEVPAASATSTTSTS
jgi:hypothetical protein